MSIINKLLKEEPYKSKLSDTYNLVLKNDWDKVPLGSHIKFIDKNGNIKSGGFLIKYIENKENSKCYYILKSNIIYKLYIYYYWIFYKKTKKKTKKTKREIFIELLNSI
jgi:hypothetical protein